MKHLAILLPLGFALSACVLPPKEEKPPEPKSLSTAEADCHRAVAAAANNPAVRVVGSEPAGGGKTMVSLLVSPGGGLQPAPWQCVAGRDGSTSDVRYVGGAEGAA